MPAAARPSLASCALVAALLLPGCGDGGRDSTGSASDSTRSATITSPAITTTAKEQGPLPKRRGAPAGDLCQSQIGSFLASMDGLRRRLAVGVTYDQYVAEVQGIRSTYRGLPIDDLRVDCLAAVGTPSEKAFNRYIEAANDWGECVSELGCGSAAIEPVLQRRWRIASHLLSEAQDGMREIAT